MEEFVVFGDNEALGSLEAFGDPQANRGLWDIWWAFGDLGTMEV